MTSTYEAPEHSATAHPLLVATADEFESLPAITQLDEYIHFKGQLEQTRARSTVYITRRFAMEFALLMALNDYENSIGLPPCDMPGPDGNGGIYYPSPVPDEWLGESV